MKTFNKKILLFIGAYFVLNSGTAFAQCTLPKIPSAITGQKFGLCGGRNIVYSVKQVQGITYNWTVPGLAHIVTGQGTNTIKVNFQSVNFQKTISVTVTNSCGASAARTLVIRSAPQKPGVINGAAIVCSNSIAVPYSIAPVAYATDYTWTGPAGSHITANGITSAGNTITTTATAVTVDFGSIASNSYVKVKANNVCGSSALSSLLLTPCSTLPSCFVTIDFNNTECGFGCNGTATVYATGGTAPYTYEWFNSLGDRVTTTETADALCGDTYTVIVTDNNGNTSSCNTTMGGGTAFLLPSWQDLDAMSSGYCSPYCNGYINLIPSLGLPQDYTYLWSTGATTNAIYNLCNSVQFEVTVWDSTGCSQSEWYTLENHISFIALGCETTSDESYPGANDGEIEASIYHGGAPFTYLWSNGQTGSTANGLSAGTYTVTVTDVSYCTASTSCTVITLSPRLEESLTSAKQITTFPNPFTDRLNINVTTDEALTVTLKDIAGRVIKIYPNVSSSFVMDIKLNNGMYFINVENQTGCYRNVLKVVRSN